MQQKSKSCNRVSTLKTYSKLTSAGMLSVVEIDRTHYPQNNRWPRLPLQTRLEATVICYKIQHFDNS